MKYTIEIPVEVKSENINLYKWVTDLKSEEYESFSTSHLAMGKYKDETGTRLINVEDIGGSLITQYYYFKKTEKAHVILHSDRSMVLVLHWFPVRINVPWEMSVSEDLSGQTILTCTIGALFPNKFLEIAARSMLLGYFLKKHLLEEAQAFAKDLELKFKN